MLSYKTKTTSWPIDYRYDIAVRHKLPNAEYIKLMFYTLGTYTLGAYARPQYNMKISKNINGKEGMCGQYKLQTQVKRWPEGMSLSTRFNESY